MLSSKAFEVCIKSIFSVLVFSSKEKQLLLELLTGAVSISLVSFLKDAQDFCST